MKIKFSTKQLDNIAKLAHAFCVASGIAAAIGGFRPNTVTPEEEFALIVACFSCFVITMLVSREG